MLSFDSVRNLQGFLQVDLNGNQIVIYHSLSQNFRVQNILNEFLDQRKIFGFFVLNFLSILVKVLQVEVVEKKNDLLQKTMDNHP